MLAQKLLSGGGAETLYVDDVFQSYVRAGSGATASVNVGFRPDLVWTKNRSSAGYNHCLFDSVRGATNQLNTDATAANNVQATALTAFTALGFDLGASNNVNQSGQNYVDWCWKKAPKFIDVVTYTGNGVAGRQIPHGLGVAPGMIIVKCTSNAEDWRVYHRSQTATKYGSLNKTDAFATALSPFNNTEPTTTVFTVGTDGAVNFNGYTYVAYLFAHDTSTDGIIQCGSFTTDGSGNATVNLGWEPQYLLAKVSNTTGGWSILDTSRGWTVTTDAELRANTSSAENTPANYGAPNATGFTIDSNAFGASNTVIYLAIRRPNKPPTSGTQVYNAIARTGSGASTVTGSGFPIDLLWVMRRDGGEHLVTDRLRSAPQTLNMESTAAEYNFGNRILGFDLMDGYRIGSDSSVNTGPLINHFFRRAVGVMDHFCDTGTGSNKLESHNLAAVPELWLRKGRSGATEWVFGSSLLANTQKIVMPSPNGVVTDATAWNSTYPTATQFSIGTSATTNTSPATYTTYMWATLAGISKVGLAIKASGSDLNVSCGFSTGARFVMLVRTDAAGDIYLWDTVRGIVSGNDPYLLLNTTAAEVTSTDYIDPYAAGFTIVNGGLPNGTYLYLAYA